MATRHDNGPQGEGVPETPESFAMPPVFETGADGEEIFDPEDAQDEAFDRAAGVFRASSTELERKTDMTLTTRASSYPATQL
jgi:hypothetical protein